MTRQVGSGLYAGVLVAVLAAVAWVSGQPFVFPSLGPSAFALASDERSEGWARRVVGSHVVGGVAGLVSYALLAGGATLGAAPPALSLAGLRLAASGAISVALTGRAMRATDTVHAPACATTLIVSLGVLPAPRQVAVLVASVAVLVAVHAGVRQSSVRVPHTG